MPQAANRGNAVRFQAEQEYFFSPKRPDQLWDPRSLLELLSVGKEAEA